MPKIVVPLSAGMRCGSICLQERNGMLKVSIPGSYLYLLRADFTILKNMLADVEIRDGHFVQVTECDLEDLKGQNQMISAEESKRLKPSQIVECEIEHD